MSIKVSPLAPAAFPVMPPIAGLEITTGACGLRYRDRTDVCIMVLEPDSSVAGVLTRSLTASAPVLWCREALTHGSARAVVVNSGNANAFTGAAGTGSVERTVDAVAGLVGCRAEEVFVASTGVIGEPLPDERLTSALAELAEGLRPDAWPEAAAAIMTTDTYPKGASRRTEIAGTPVTINGIAKGSGMIAPDMATMLSFIATDANLPSALLQDLLADANERTFNSITVDGDTSTSDTVLLLATGKAENSLPTGMADPALTGFRAALEDLLRDLAIQVVKDGEGASKFVTIDVAGAETPLAARTIGLAIGNSPLVKTAVAGEDPNWGRIVMAVGKAGERADRDRLSIKIGGIEVAKNGWVVPGYDEAPVAEHMKGQAIEIAVDVGVGDGSARVWTCDLGHGYIDINADYRS
ncbi:bifunctional glutamate N-acetyltransferase/amino-acid acetyltransferase ArgJ [Pelagibius sp. Alg239-R121]|uniref:bifunctional glutamate N-acetyltransferase/amino-acid acetyltransferase ArgJ n=1 Tax=Pelagibius sp. Alg239-R121 TaxID=2993448 RepID=UPI0024A6B80B|nr:bifunctional glutamate N-acetyltransferase/amino-acid acetyltransferase ArgJ [Pelagibius sp. Alg239-R121]